MDFAGKDRKGHLVQRLDARKLLADAAQLQELRRDRRGGLNGQRGAHARAPSAKIFPGFIKPCGSMGVLMERITSTASPSYLMHSPVFTTPTPSLSHTQHSLP